jgi:aerobic carbon-monoxide dehydrogenase medium subunit
MIPAAFDYVRAGSVDEAISLLGSREDAKVLAGGHSLLPLMKLRLARPSTLVDIGRLSDLSYIREDGDIVTIGALTRHHDVATSDALHELCPIMSYTAGEIGDPQVRHVGTIGGSVAHADPASDMPAVLVALDASFAVQGPSGSRTVAAREFFKGLFTPDLAENEVLTEIRVPKTAGRKWSYIKFHRRAQDWALVGVAAVSGNGAGGASVALTNMGETPIRASAVESALAGGADPAAAAASAAEGTSPPSDSFGSADYRRELVKVLTRRALQEVMG